MVGVGPARRDGAVYQADPAVDHLDGLLGGGHEFLQHFFDDGHERGHDPRHRRLREIMQITQEFLRNIMTEIHARDLYRCVQSK